jgi:hypothetical protein
MRRSPWVGKLDVSMPELERLLVIGRATKSGKCKEALGAQNISEEVLFRGRQSDPQQAD